MNASRQQRYGSLVRGWSWRTTQARLDGLEKFSDVSGASQTETLEFCIDFTLNAQKYGCVDWKGIPLVLWGYALQTGRNLSASQYFSDDADEKMSEWSALAYSGTGEAYTVYWVHEFNGKEADSYDWSNVWHAERCDGSIGHIDFD